MNLDSYIEEFKLNNYNHFKAFYNETVKQIYFTAYGILSSSDDADDIVQDTYISFLNNIDSFKIGTNIYAYLTTIARNKSINLYNKAKREVHNDDFLSYIPDENSKPKYESNANIEAILGLLTNQIEREIVVYHVLLDYKFIDIAGIMNMKLGTVLWRYNKAMKLLKEKVSLDA